MAEVEEARPCIKLFGTVILKECKKEGKEEPGEATPRTPSTAGETAMETVNEAAARAAAAAALPCPRCKSKETKFCYFNNYNVNQPRHFCKACHRYWTAGGTLRNVPVGAGRRRGRPSAAASAAAVRGGSPVVGSVSGGDVSGYDARTALGGQGWWFLQPERPTAGSDGGFVAGFR